MSGPKEGHRNSTVKSESKETAAKYTATASPATVSPAFVLGEAFTFLRDVSWSTWPCFEAWEAGRIGSSALETLGARPRAPAAPAACAARTATAAGTATAGAKSASNASNASTAGTSGCRAAGSTRSTGVGALSSVAEAEGTQDFLGGVSAAHQALQVFSPARQMLRRLPQDVRGVGIGVVGGNHDFHVVHLVLAAFRCI
mmetsp:Transcript_62975/g.103347  ORF Transcript_62975/g.103347 Transcript_62975/m.103347 type:complete len:200 (+) Transcript_62975:152-751(+)